MLLNALLFYKKCRNNYVWKEVGTYPYVLYLVVGSAIENIKIWNLIVICLCYAAIEYINLKVAKNIDNNCPGLRINNWKPSTK